MLRVNSVLVFLLIFVSAYPNLAQAAWKEKAFIPGMSGDVLVDGVEGDLPHTYYRLLDAPDGMRINGTRGNLFWKAPIHTDFDHVHVTIEIEKRTPNRKLRKWESEYRQIEATINVASMNPLELLDTGYEDTYKLYPVSLVLVQANPAPISMVYLEDEPDDIFSVSEKIIPITKIFYNSEYDKNVEVDILLPKELLSEHLDFKRFPAIYRIPTGFIGRRPNGWMKSSPPLEVTIDGTIYFLFQSVGIHTPMFVGVQLE